MKPPPFDYHAPATTAEAVAVLAEVGSQGKVLAGGQSLIPLLNMRLAAPAHLIDITELAELAEVTVTDDGVRVGAAVRQSRVERDLEIAAACPLLVTALRLVAHPVIRNRGTVCGSIAHADPAAELTAVLALLGGSVTVASADGSRELAAADFFLGPLETAMVPCDLVTSVTFPRLPAATGTAFVEVARRHGDYALCGVAATVERDGDGAVTSAKLGLISVAPTPLVVDVTAAVGGAGTAPDALDLDAAAEQVRAATDPDADIHATVAYRRHLAGTLTRRALTAALADTGAGHDGLVVSSGGYGRTGAGRHGAARGSDG